MMQISTKSLFLGLMVSLALSAQSVQAVSVSTVGSFNDPLATNPKYFFNLTDNQDNDSTPVDLPISSVTDSVAYYGWGIDLVDSFITGNIIQSHFWFNGAGSVAGGAAASAPLGTAFSLGTFTYVNQQTVLSGGIVKIDFQMAINIDIDGVDVLLNPVEYRIEINNTREGGSNPADTARLISTPANIPFLLGGSQYLLTFNGFLPDGGSTYETEATLAEGGTTSAQIYATITAVPVPAAIWLMGSGLLALFGFARTKK